MENYKTGDASLDNTLNQDGIGENELLIASFGTSFNKNRRLTIGAIEKKMMEAFPGWDVRRAFTSEMIVEHVKRRDGVSIDILSEALDRAEKNGVKNLVVQPTHVMGGLEYTDVVNAVTERKGSFEKVAVGKPLLASDEDFREVIRIITEATKEFDDGKTAIVFMGHGTIAKSNSVYTKMQEMMSAAGFANYYIGTIDAAPGLGDVVQMVKNGDYRKVVLEPLLIVCGDHANNDMAGDGKDSWKSAFEAAGFEVTCVMRGLGEMEDIRELLAAHARKTVESIE